MNIKIETIGKDTVKLSWKSSNPSSKISISYGPSPEQIDHHSPRVIISDTTVAEISGLKPDVRYYFRISSKGIPDVIIAPRRVHLDKSVNFRDLGGYQTTDGRRIKWGKVFRSDNLSRLSDSDQAKLKNMGIQRVCDFRTTTEANQSPDKFPGKDSKKYLHLPVSHGKFDNTALFERIKKGDVSWISTDFIIKSYIHYCEEFADTWAEIMKQLAHTQNLPLVFHCTAGKDRAGTCAALLLLALGVNEETVIEDHSLSNIYIAGVLDRINAYMRSLDVDPETVRPYFTAPKECIIALINHIKEHYGSASNYFIKKTALRQKTITHLKENLLE